MGHLAVVPSPEAYGTNTRTRPTAPVSALTGLSGEAYPHLGTGPARGRGNGVPSATMTAMSTPDDTTPTSTCSPHQGVEADRRHRRVRHPRGRREGEGAEGRGSPGDRLRRGRARLPHPAEIVEAAVEAACARPPQPPLHARGGPARAARGRRGQDAARLRARGRRAPGAHHQRRQAGRLPGVRDDRSTRATRCCCPRRTGPPTPRRSRSPAAFRCRSRPTSRPDYLVDRRAAGGGPHRRAPRCCCCARRPTRPARSYSREQIERDRRVGRRARHLGGRPTRSTSTWSTTAPRHVSHARRRARSWPTATIVVNGVAKTYAMTGWRVGWLIGPADVIKAAANLQSHLTSNVSNVVAAGRAGGGVRAAGRGARDAGGVRPAAADDRRAAVGDSRCGVPDAARGVLRLPVGEGAARAGRCAGAAIGSSAELAGLILEHAEVAVVPGEAFGTPGYLRLSYALGDSDLVEGVGRVVSLLGECAVG